MQGEHRDSESRNVRGPRVVGQSADLHFAAPKRFEPAPKIFLLPGFFSNKAGGSKGNERQGKRSGQVKGPVGRPGGRAV